MNRIDAILVNQDEKSHKIEAFLDALADLLQSVAATEGASEDRTPSAVLRYSIVISL